MVDMIVESAGKLISLILNSSSTALPSSEACSSVITVGGETVMIDVSVEPAVTPFHSALSTISAVVPTASVASLVGVEVDVEAEVVAGIDVEVEAVAEVVDVSSVVAEVVDVRSIAAEVNVEAEVVAEIDVEAEAVAEVVDVSSVAAEVVDAVDSDLTVISVAASVLDL